MDLAILAKELNQPIHELLGTYLQGWASIILGNPGVTHSLGYRGWASKQSHQTEPLLLAQRK